MEIEGKEKKIINRVKFFSLTGKAVLAFLAIKLIPFPFSKKNEKKVKKKIEVRINSFAVQRNNKGEKHV